MFPARMSAFGVLVAVVSACAATPQPPLSRSYDLTFSHPSPYANYIQVVPGTRDAALPQSHQILSSDFSKYLRNSTGCVVDASRPTAVLGSHQVPAGFMVPISCP